MSSPSPVVLVPARRIPEKTRLLLAARSGGRCEICNKYTFEHPLTLQDGNFSQDAHIVAFSERGPRAHDGDRPDDVHSIDNLMHLCLECHKLVDDHPTKYPRAVLESYKTEHENPTASIDGCPAPGGRPPGGYRVADRHRGGRLRTAA